ncbi:MAG: hypothetical protein ABH950_07255 [Candidatus Altiarchaeota archaeon]
MPDASPFSPSRRQYTLFLLVLTITLLLLSTPVQAGLIGTFGKYVGCVTKNSLRPELYLLPGGPLTFCILNMGFKWFFDQLGELMGSLIEGLIRMIMSCLTWNPQIFPLYTTGCDVDAGECASQGVSHIIISIMIILMPLYVILILYTGIQMIFFSLTPQGRAQSKSRLNEFIISMVVVSLSPMLYQVILDLSESVVYAILNVAVESMNSPGTDLAGFLILFLILAKTPILLPMTIILLVISLIALMVLLVRYIFVLLYGVLFPAILFLYLFDTTKQMGSKLLARSIMWITIPIAQSIFMALVIISLVQTGSTIGTPLLHASEALIDLRFADALDAIKDLGPGLIEALKSMLLVMGGLVGLILAPLMMSGLLEKVGGAVGFVGAASAPYTPAGGALVGAGTMMMGSGADSLISAGALAGFLHRGPSRTGVDQGVGGWFKEAGRGLTSGKTWRNMVQQAGAGMFPDKFPQGQTAFELEFQAQEAGGFSAGGSHTGGGGGQTSSISSSQTGEYHESQVADHTDTQWRTQGRSAESTHADRESSIDPKGFIIHTHRKIHDLPMPLLPFELHERSNKIQMGLASIFGGASLFSYAKQHGFKAGAKKFFSKDLSGQGVVRRSAKGMSLIASGLMPISPLMPIRMLGRELFGFVPAGIPNWLGGGIVRRAALIMMGMGFRQHWHRRKADASIKYRAGKHENLDLALEKAKKEREELIAAGQDTHAVDNKIEGLEESIDREVLKVTKILDGLANDPTGFRSTDPFYYEKKLQSLLQSKSASDRRLAQRYMAQAMSDNLGRDRGQRDGNFKNMNACYQTAVSFASQEHKSGDKWNPEARLHAHALHYFQRGPGDFNVGGLAKAMDMDEEYWKIDTSTNAGKQKAKEVMDHFFSNAKNPNRTEADTFLARTVAASEIQARGLAVDKGHDKIGGILIERPGITIENGRLVYRTVERTIQGIPVREDGKIRTRKWVEGIDFRLSDFAQIERKNSVVMTKRFHKLEGAMAVAARNMEWQEMRDPFDKKNVWHRRHLDRHTVTSEDGREEAYLNRHQYAYLRGVNQKLGYGGGLNPGDEQLIHPLNSVLERYMGPGIEGQVIDQNFHDNPDSGMATYRLDQFGNPVATITLNQGAQNPRDQLRKLRIKKKTQVQISHHGEQDGNIILGNGLIASTTNPMGTAQETYADVKHTTREFYEIQDQYGVPQKNYVLVKQTEVLDKLSDSAGNKLRVTRYTVVDLSAAKPEYKFDALKTGTHPNDFWSEVLNHNPHKDIYKKDGNLEEATQGHIILRDYLDKDLRFLEENNEIVLCVPNYSSYKYDFGTGVEQEVAVHIVDKKLQYFRIEELPNGRKRKIPLDAYEQARLNQMGQNFQVQNVGGVLKKTEWKKIENVEVREGKIYEAGTNNELTHINLKSNEYKGEFKPVHLNDEVVEGHISENQFRSEFAVIHEKGHIALRTATGTLTESDSGKIVDSLTSKKPKRKLSGDPTYDELRLKLESTRVGGESVQDLLRAYSSDELLGQGSVGHLFNELNSNAAVHNHGGPADHALNVQKTRYFQEELAEKMAYLNANKTRLSKADVVNLAQIRTIAEEYGIPVSGEFRDSPGLEGFNTGGSMADLIDDVVAKNGGNWEEKYYQARAVSEALWTALTT